VRRLPFKRGFTNIRKVYYKAVNLDQLAERFSAGAEVTPESLAAVGLIKKSSNPVVILGRGELDFALKVTADRFSAGARVKIEAAGGSVAEVQR
jgi:large subunit ribosomal protein L15